MLYLAQNQLVSGYKRDILFWSGLDSLLILMSVIFYMNSIIMSISRLCREVREYS